MLFVVKDYINRTWCVVESRPTEHGMQVLLGHLSLPDGTLLHRRRAPMVIITRELQEYFEKYRMRRGAMRLPISQNVIHRIRTELGMNYVKDRNIWWEQLRQAATNSGAPDALKSLSWDTPHKTWDKEELLDLAQRAKTDKTADSIAGDMGKPYRATDNFRRKLFGVQKKQYAWVREDVDTLRRLCGEGRTAAEIARQMGRTTKSIIHKTAKLNLKCGYPDTYWTEADIATLRRLCGEGKTVEEMAEALGRSRHSIIFHRRKYVGAKWRCSKKKPE